MITVLITIFSIIFVLFLPGLVVSFLFFSQKEIDILERIALSIGLSLAIVPLIVFYANLAGIKITKLSVILEILGILGIAGILLVFKYKLLSLTNKENIRNR